MQGIPVVFEENKPKAEPVVCDRRHKDFYDPLPANPKISGYDSSGNFAGEGTMGFVGWNSDANNPYKCYITAAHVITFDDGSTAVNLRHQGEYNGSQRTEYVGSFVVDSPENSTGLDAAKYKRNSGTVKADLRGNADSHLGEVAGTWTYSGLSDATSGTGSVNAEFAGASTCYLTANCIDTARNEILDYQAHYDNATVGGDSGGPWLDNDDFLIGLNTHSCDASSCNDSYGPTAKEVLDRLNAQLFDPALG